MQFTIDHLKVGHLVHAKHPKAIRYGRKPIKLKPEHLRMIHREVAGMNVKPVDITEQLLIDYGFEKSFRVEKAECIDTFQRNNAQIDFIDGKFYFNHLGWLSRLEYFHQIQDFYLLVEQSDV